MSKHVVVSGSLAAGFTVTGPFPNWGSACHHSDTVAPPENGRLNEIFKLREPAIPSEGGFVLLVGNPIAGYDMWGPFPLDVTAANAASPFHAHTVNPDNQQCVVFRLTPGEGELMRPTASTIADDVWNAAEALAAAADNTAWCLSPVGMAVHRLIAEAADAAYSAADLAADLARDASDKENQTDV